MGGFNLYTATNPRSGANQSTDSETEMRCLCGKRMLPVVGDGYPFAKHRPNTLHKDGQPLSRKARKAAWCPIPELVSKANAAGLALVN